VGALVLVGGKSWLQHYGLRPCRRFRRGERARPPGDGIGEPEVRGMPP
jgi:hypothetical protein